VINNFAFNYSPPSITSINPVAGFGTFQLTITGSGFGPTAASPLKIILKFLSDNEETACLNPTWQSTNGILCTVPIIKVGNYSVLVDVGGQRSIQLVTLGILAVPPPIANDIEVIGKQTTTISEKLLILITLTVSRSLTPFNSFVRTLPKSGTLYQLTATNTKGSVIQNPGDPVLGSRLYYEANDYFSGIDQFTYYVNDGSDSNDAKVNILISFTNQAPFFINPKYPLPLNEDATTYNIDLLSLISDKDEFSNFTMMFKSIPSRGKWKLNGKEELFNKNSTLLRTDQPSLLQLELDGSGGSTPYFSFSVVVYDSYGLESTNELEITGLITCSAANALNTWGTGPICVACPVGAVSYSPLTLDMVSPTINFSSPTGEFPITNDFGYYAVETSINNQTTVIFIRCVPPEACPARQFKSSAQTCATGYSGSRCGVCAQRYYSYGSVCNKCPDLNFSPVALGGIALAVLIIVMYLAYKMSKMDVGFIGVVYTYFQVNDYITLGSFSILQIKFIMATHCNELSGIFVYFQSKH
jgi:IPT/TIG domain